MTTRAPAVLNMREYMILVHGFKKKYFPNSTTSNEVGSSQQMSIQCHFWFSVEVETLPMLIKHQYHRLPILTFGHINNEY